MVRSTQRTLFMLDLDIHRTLGYRYKPLENTTLNEKFAVLVDTLPENLDTYPVVGYWAIGTGGEIILEDSKNYVFNEHAPIDGALFNHVPFIMRELTQDLTKEEKENYRMRVIETHNGKEYACYYLRKVASKELKQIFYSVRTLVDNITKEQTPILTPLDLTAEPVLNPTPAHRVLNYKNMKDVEYVAYLNKVILSLTNADFKELDNVLKIRQLNVDYITEIGLCSGIEVNALDYPELIYTQVMFHVGVTLSMLTGLSKKTGTNIIIELGGMEPFLKGSRISG